MSSPSSPAVVESATAAIVFDGFVSNSFVGSGALNRLPPPVAVPNENGLLVALIIPPFFI